MKRRLASLLGVILVTSIPSHADFIKRVVDQGDPSPDGNGFFSNPDIKDCVADGFVFTDSLANTSGGSSDNQGVFVWWKGELRTAYREGSPALDGNGEFSSSVFSNSQPIRMTDDGLVIIPVAYRNSSGGTTDDRGIVIYDCERDVLTSLAREGSPSPRSSGDTILNGGIDCYDVNKSGYMVLALQTTGVSGIFDASLPTGSWATELTIGDNTPSGDGTYSEIDVIRTGSSTNDFSFTADLSGTSGGAADDFGIFLHDSVVEEVAREGDLLPDGNGTYASFGNTITGATTDDMFFLVQANGTSGGSSDDIAIIYYRGGVLSMVAREGAPEAGGDGNYGSVFTLKTAPSSRQAVFTASLDGTSGGFADDSAIYRVSSAGLVSTIAREGQALPNGLPLGFIRGFAVAPNLDLTFYDSFGIYRSSTASSTLTALVDTTNDLPDTGFSSFSSISACADDEDGTVFAVGDVYMTKGLSVTNYIGTDGGSWDDGANWSGLDFAPQYFGDINIRPELGITVNGPATNVYPDSLDLDALNEVPMTFVLKPTGLIGLQDGRLDLDTAILTGAGVITGEIDAGTTSLIRPTGSMQLGDVNDTLGFRSTGRIELNGQSLTLLDSNGASLDDELDLQNGTLKLLGGGGDNAGVIRGSGRIEGTLLSNRGDINAIGEHIIFDLPVTNVLAFGIINASSLSILEFRSGITNDNSLAFSFGNSNVFGDITNGSSGRIVVSGNSEVTFWDDLVHNGTDVKVSSGSTAVFFGNISGPGPFSGTGTTFLEGDYQPGASPASVDFGGDLHLGSLNTLEMELGGTTPGTGHDQLVVTGFTFLNGGVMDVQLIDGFVPSPGDSFLLFDAAAIDGDFGTINLPSLPLGTFWDTRTLTDDGTLRVGVVPPDYNTWLTAWGIPGTGNEDGDPFEDVLEYLLGLDPTTGNPSSDGTEFYTDTVVGGIRFDIPYPASSDARYEVEASTTLDAESWDTIATKVGTAAWSGSGAVTVNIGSDGTQEVIITDEALSTPPGRQFFRLRGTIQP